MSTMTVGEIAKAVGVSAKAIRLWEAKGLVRGVERTGGGYRVFTEADVEILRFIRQSQALGLTLSEIKEVLGLRQAGAPPCCRVQQLLDERIAEIDRMLVALRQLRQTLSDTKETGEACPSRRTTAGICHIIEGANAREVMQ